MQDRPLNNRNSFVHKPWHKYTNSKPVIYSPTKHVRY